MTTKRKQSAATARVGVNYARSIVEDANCTFQEVDQTNDLGNDAYIEFVEAEQATGCCIAAQIKTGKSYVAPDGSFVLPADRAHFEYWSSHVLPVCAILYDPRRALAAWCDVTEYLRRNPAVVRNGPFRISVPADRVFSGDTFSAFRAHFRKHTREFSDDAHFGAALAKFTPFEAPGTRVAALRALFGFHRNRSAMWCYIASLLRTIENEALLRLTVRALSHITGGMGDISWSKENLIDTAATLDGRGFINVSFGRAEVVKLLSSVDEEGFARGEIGQAAHSVIDMVRNAPSLLESIAFDESLSEDIRYAAIVLFVYYVQETSSEICLEQLAAFRASNPGRRSMVIREIEATLKEFGAVGFY